MTVPTDTTVILYKGTEISPRLHPVDVAAWKTLGWEEKKEALAPPKDSDPVAAETTVILYKGEESSPPLHPIDAGTWMRLGWTETQPELSIPVAQKATVDETKTEDPPRKRTVKVETT